MIKSTRLMRTTALSLLMLIAFSVALPVINSSAHNGRNSAHHGRKYRRHSRAWRRRHRAMLRRRRQALAARKASATLLAMRNHDDGTPLAPPAASNTVQMIEERRAVKRVQARVANLAAATQPTSAGALREPRGRWNMALPGGWSGRSQGANGAMTFRVVASDGRLAGEAALTPMSLGSTANDIVTGKPQHRTLGGVPLGQLRAAVIDRMVSSGGWVVNDMERVIGGQRVYVVIAQTPQSEDGRTPQQNWAFYFTVLNGQIYRFETGANADYAEHIAADVERIISSITAGAGAAAAAPPRP